MDCLSLSGVCAVARVLCQTWEEHLIYHVTYCTNNSVFHGTSCMKHPVLHGTLCVSETVSA